MGKLKLNGLLQFISGIIFVVAGIITFTNPKIALNAATYIMIASFILYGLGQVAMSFSSSKDAKFGRFIGGIIVILLGVLMINFLTTTKITFLVYIYLMFGFGFMYMASAQFSFHLRNMKKYAFWQVLILLILDVFILLFSVLMFLSPQLELEVISIFIGINFMIMGFVEIGNSFHTKAVIDQGGNDDIIDEEKDNK